MSMLTYNSVLICRFFKENALVGTFKYCECDFIPTINVEIEELYMQASARVARVCGAWEVTA